MREKDCVISLLLVWHSAKDHITTSTTLRLYDFTTCDLEAHDLKIWKEDLRSGGGAFGGAPFYHFNLDLSSRGLLDRKSWSRSRKSREVVEVVMWSFALCHINIQQPLSLSILLCASHIICISLQSVCNEYCLITEYQKINNVTANILLLESVSSGHPNEARLFVSFSEILDSAPYKIRFFVPA